MIRRYRILAVDDEPVVRQVLKEALGKDYVILSLPSANDFERMVINFKPDLVILDINMPMKSGYEVCYEMRCNPVFDHIPILFLSALIQERDKFDAFSVGGTRYLTKPFELPQLRHVVAAMIGRKHRYPDEDRQSVNCHQWQVPWSPSSRFSAYS